MYPSSWIPHLLPEPAGTAVQVGSNDGRTGDPLHAWLQSREGWSAILVEPVPFLFERLRETYAADPRFIFENVVINDGSDAVFHWVSEKAAAALPGLPYWHDQLGGFSREHITRHLPQVEPYIESAILPGLTLVQLLEKHGLASLDLLHIDAEGADFRILRQLPLERWAPRVILYERKHLSGEEEAASIAFLEARYALYELGADMLAVSRAANAALRSTLGPLQRFRVPGRVG